MFNSKLLENILFVDVETVPAYASFEEMPDRWKELWAKKASFLAKNNESAEEIYDRAGIYAEFGKIICISAAYFVKQGKVEQLRVKSFYGHDEKIILAEFIQLLNQSFNSEDHYLCAHNGKEFDFPYLGRRMLANGLTLPALLQLAGKKPWEVKHLDTMQLWKFGDYKSYTSLELLAAVFDIPTPKDDIDGSKIYEVYYKDSNLERIRTYCQKDVVTLARLFLRITNQQEIKGENVVIVN